MKFLVVDDSATMRCIVVNSLRRVGITEIVEAENGREALDRFDPSVRFVITDWNMPQMSGAELASSLRARGEHVPVLLIAARSAREDLMRALEAGVNGYLVKPFTPQVLKEKIEAMLAGVGVVTTTAG